MWLHDHSSANKYYARSSSLDSIDSGDFGYLNKEDIKYKLFANYTVIMAISNILILS